MLFNIYRALLLMFSLPLVLSEYFKTQTGSTYNVGFVDKLLLLTKMTINQFRVRTASNFLEHLIMAKDILRAPKTLEGVVVECGCFKGGSTANLSLVCALAGRRLVVFDSFSGLPEPQSYDRQHTLLDKGELHVYAKGFWSGDLDEVKGNVARYGCMDVCEFRPGYFEESLPHFKCRVTLAFVDADLRDSVKTCLTHLWPLMQDNCRLYTHEAQHLEIATLFFDPLIWNGAKPPGLIGAGIGLPLVPQRGGFGSSLAYTVKNPDIAAFHRSVESGGSALR